jgi:Ca2+-transporting ATPase
VVTVTLALGARRMLRRHALIRSLPAAEALGSVTVICSDKTGTLTENRMTVTVVDVAGHRRDLVETLRHGEAALDTGEAGTAPGDAEEGVAMVLAAGALCSDAALVEGPSPGAFHAVGDPTEGALVVAAARSGMMRRDLESLWPRHGEAPFDSERKRMSTVHALPAAEAAARLRLPRSWAADPAAPGRESLVVTKGSVDGLVSLCTGVWSEGKVLPLDGSWQRRISGAANAMAGGGMRVLGFAFRRLAAEAAGGAPPALSLEHSLVFIGMAGLLDPPRAEARAAVELCRSAGIRPVMITGDHPLTALAIARDLGITDAGTGARAVTGSEIDAAPAGSLGDLAARAPVFARVSPEHKLRLVRALQTRGEVVAMTGDGVNDAPALRTADVGVAMGITGTDVARDASDIVLTDDNFASIVAAVEEGRVIVANIRRFVTFSMSGNLGKILLMLAAPLAGIPVALYPLQLLWLNLLTDGLLGLAMGFEPAEPGVMRRRPAPPRPGILSRASVLHIGWVGVLIALLALGTGVVARGLGIAEWRGTIFALLGFLQLWESFAVRSERVSVFHLPFTGNRVLLLLATLVAALQAAILGVPALGGLLGLPALSPPAILACAGLGSIVFLAMELEKLVTRRRAALHEPVAR